MSQVIIVVLIIIVLGLLVSSLRYRYFLKLRTKALKESSKDFDEEVKNLLDKCSNYRSRIKTLEKKLDAFRITPL